MAEPMPDTETPPIIRRKLTSVLPLAIGVGILVVVAAGMFFSFKTTVLIFGVCVWLTFEVAFFASAFGDEE